MLQLTGKCTEVESKQMFPKPGQTWEPFTATTIFVGTRRETVRVRVAGDFPPADLPKEGDDVTLLVSVSVFEGKYGPGLQYTALERVKSAGLRAAASA